MADTAAAITPGSGLNVDTRTEATNGNHRQVVVLGDPSTNAGVAPVDATNGLAVDVKQMAPGTGASSLGKAEDAVHSSGDVGVMALAVRKDSPTQLAGTDGDYSPMITDSAGRLHVNGIVAGDNDHDAVDAGYPVKIGMKAIAHSSNPTAVAAGDRTNLFANRHGIPFMIGGHMNAVTVEAAYTSAQTDQAIITISTGLKIVVTHIQVVADNANTNDTGVRVGFGTASTPTTTGVVATHPGIARGSGLSVGDGNGIIGIGADNEDLRITSENPGGEIRVKVTYYTIES